MTDEDRIQAIEDCAREITTHYLDLQVRLGPENPPGTSHPWNIEAMMMDVVSYTEEATARLAECGAPERRAELAEWVAGFLPGDDDRSYAADLILRGEGK